MDGHKQKSWITAADVANYVVCPEAWRLKLDGQRERPESERSAQIQEIRAAWARDQDLSSRLATYAKVAYVLLVLLTMLVFYLESRRSEYVHAILSQSLSSGEVPKEILSLLLTLGLVIFMWDLFERRSRSLRKSSGLDEKTEAVAVKGSSERPGRSFSSSELGLKSKPGALVQEDGVLVPVDIHPLTNKIRDRHIVQLLVHLRLVEAEEGKRPEHGILLMGKGQRKVLVRNTPEKQRWLETLIDEMRSIQDGVPAVASPVTYKCKTCDVRRLCRFSAWKDGRTNSPELGPEISAETEQEETSLDERKDYRKG